MDPNLSPGRCLHDEVGVSSAASEMEWCSRERDRVLLQVVYTALYTMRRVLKLDSGQALEYDKTNQLHLLLFHGARQAGTLFGGRDPGILVRRPSSSG